MEEGPEVLPPEAGTGGSSARLCALALVAPESAFRAIAARPVIALALVLLIAAGASVSETPGEAIDPVASLPIYVDTFAMLAWVAVGVGAVVLVLAPWLRRWMHEDVV